LNSVKKLICVYYEGKGIDVYTNVDAMMHMQSYVNKIEFDYKEYARQRFQQYWLSKATLSDSPSIVSQDQTLNGSLPLSYDFASDSY